MPAEQRSVRGAHRGARSVPHVYIMDPTLGILVDAADLATPPEFFDACSD